MFKFSFGGALLRLFCLLAFALSFSGLAHAQNPARPTLSLFADPPTFEGAPATFRVVLSNPATQNLTFFFGTNGQTALEGPIGPFDADYDGITTNGDYTIKQGDTTLQIRVATNQDTSYEFDETFTAFITDPRFNGQPATSVILGQTQVTQTIRNDDPPPVVTLITPDPILEGDTNVRARQNYNFTVNIGSTMQDPNRETLGRPITLAFTTVDGTAVANGVGGTAAGQADYEAVSANVVTVPAGTRQFQYTVIVLGDDVYEGDEFFTLNAEYSPPLANTAPSTATGNIRDNDLPTYSIDLVDPGTNATVEEGNPLNYVITLRDRQGVRVNAQQDVVFTYVLQNVTAIAGTDFTDPNLGTFTIPRGSSQFVLTFPTIDDDIVEQTETFNFIIRNATGTRAPEGNGANVGVGTILDTADNNAGTVLTLQDSAVVEGTGGTNAVTFTVNLTKVTSQTVSVNYETLPSVDPDPARRATPGINNPPTPNADFISRTGTLTFPPGTTSVPFDISVATDGVNELDENFRVRLFNPVNATFANQATELIRNGTIFDDDSAGVVTAAVANLNVAENVQSGFANVLVNFTPTAGTRQIRPVTVNFATVPDTAIEDGSFKDYFAKSGTLTFQPDPNGMPTQLIIPIEIVDDNIFEGNESFSVVLSLTATSGATLGNPSVTRVTIVDNEIKPVVTVRPAAPVSENAGVKNFVVVATGRSQTPIVVNYNFVDGTATNSLAADGSTVVGGDYTGTPGTLTFVPGGPTSFFVSVPILEDQVAEGNETFSLVLSKDAADMSFDLPTTTATSTVVIVDNDLTPDFLIGDASVPEGNVTDPATVTELVFPVTLTRASSRPVTFSYSLLNLRKPDCTPANGCDVASNADYTIARNVNFTIPAGTTASEIRVPVTQDALNEFNEQFALVSRGLTNAVPAVYRDAGNNTQRFGTTAFGTIVNDDPGGNITISGPTDPQGNAITTIAEGYNRGGGNRRVGEAAYFTVTLPSPAGRTVTVNYGYARGVADATDVEDLTTGPGNGRITFFNGDTTRVISLRAIADNKAEGSERLNVALSINDNNGANSYTANNAASNVTILDRTPQVNNLAPNIGFPAYGTVAATRVTINGSQLRTEGNPRVDAVLFGSAEVGRGGIQYTNDNSLVVSVPDNAKTGPVRLRLVDGSIVSNLGLTAITPVQTIPNFVVQPVILNFTPATAVANATTLVITGRNFQDSNNAVTAVRFADGTQALVGQGATVIGENRIDVLVPATAGNGPLSIVSAAGGVGPASQTALSVVSATPGNITLGGTPDSNAIVEGSGVSFGQPARNVNGGFHAPYQFFLNPARQSSGANAGQPVAFTPLTVRFTIKASVGGGNVPRIQLRFDPANTGRPTAFSGKSGDNGILDIKLDKDFNPASPLEIAIVDAGTDDQPPIVGGTPANVTVTAQIVQSDNTTLFPLTPATQIPTIQVDRVQPVDPATQTALAFGANTTNSFSIPYVAGASNSVAITDAFNVAPGDNRYTVYRFDAANQMNNVVGAGGTRGSGFVALPNNGRLERGVGYLLVVGNAGTVQLKTRNVGVVPAGNAFAINLTRNVPFAASTNSQGNSTNGYNFIGFPFDPSNSTPVNFNAATLTVDGATRSIPDAAAAGLINPQLFVIDGNGQLVPANTNLIQPFQAYFVQIFRDNATLTLTR